MINSFSGRTLVGMTSLSVGVSRFIFESRFFVGLVPGVDALPVEGVDVGDVGLAMLPEVVNVARVVVAKSGDVTSGFLTRVGGALDIGG